MRLLWAIAVASMAAADHTCDASVEGLKSQGDLEARLTKADAPTSALVVYRFPWCVGGAAAAAELPAAAACLWQRFGVEEKPLIATVDVEGQELPLGKVVLQRSPSVVLFRTVGSDPPSTFPEALSFPYHVAIPSPSASMRKVAHFNVSVFDGQPAFSADALCRWAARGLGHACAPLSSADEFDEVRLRHRLTLIAGLSDVSQLSQFAVAVADFPCYFALPPVSGELRQRLKPHNAVEDEMFLFVVKAFDELIEEVEVDTLSQNLKRNRFATIADLDPSLATAMFSPAWDSSIFLSFAPGETRRGLGPQAREVKAGGVQIVTADPTSALARRMLRLLGSPFATPASGGKGGASQKAAAAAGIRDEAWLLVPEAARNSHTTFPFVKYRSSWTPGDAADALAFIESQKAGKLTPFSKSEAVPEKQRPPVFKVVGSTINPLVFDNPLNVVIIFFVPWCEHSQSFLPAFRAAAQQLQDSHTNLLVGQFDAASNDLPPALVAAVGHEVARKASTEFPTVLLFLQGRKNKPVFYDGQRNTDAFVQFVSAHIPRQTASKGDAAGKQTKPADPENTSQAPRATDEL